MDHIFADNLKYSKTAKRKAVKIIHDRILQYNPQNEQDEIYAFMEVVQKITLSALSRSNFFQQAALRGATCLCLFYGLPRFSKDLDFMLYEPNKNFEIQNFINEIKKEFSIYSEAFPQAYIKAIDVKLDVDTFPLDGAKIENKKLIFPKPFSIVSHTMPSLFAGKLNALLDRQYPKGSDWYDFIWYVNRKSHINIEFLQSGLQKNALEKNLNKTVLSAKPDLKINHQWIIDALIQKIENTDWEEAKNQVVNLVRPKYRPSLELWNQEFFLHYTQAMKEYLL